jgi:hypothetical protein
VVTNTDRCGGVFRVEVDSGADWLEVVTGAKVTPLTLKMQVRAKFASEIW